MIQINIKIETASQTVPFTLAMPTNTELFYHFPPKPYTENPEFTQNLVIGSGGGNYTIDGVSQTNQIIVRLDLGHKSGITCPHLNIDFAAFKDGTEKRKRVPFPYDPTTGYPHMLTMSPHVRITVTDLTNNAMLFYNQIDLSEYCVV